MSVQFAEREGTPLPPSLAVTPNIAWENQTLEQLIAEHDYWVVKSETARHAASAKAADDFRRACVQWIRRRKREHAQSSQTDGGKSMSGGVEARQHCDERHVARALTEFVSDQRHSQSIARRWLALWIETVVLPRVEEVRTDKIGPATRHEINSLRLEEIARERETRQREIDKLDVEARNLQAAG